MESWNQTKKKSKLRLCIIWSVMVTLILVVWSLLILPIVFYNMPATFTGNSSLTITSHNSECLLPHQYSTEGVCFESLQGILRSLDCDLNNTGAVLVATDNEIYTRSVLNNLNLLKSSSECSQDMLAFLCLYFFPLCGDGGNTIQPTMDQCADLQETCSEEWRLLTAAVGMHLPNCSLLPLEQNISCSSTKNISMLFPTLTCQKDFFLDKEKQTCIPSCRTWKQYGEVTTTVVQVVIITAGCIGMLLAVIAIIVSILRHKTVFQFPSVFLVYATLDVLIYDFFLVLGNSNRNLFCSSEGIDFINETSFCVVYGIVFSYSIVQLGLWWMFHLGTLFWGVWFPFHYQKYKTNGWLKYVHIALLLLGLFLPLITIISTMVDFARSIRGSQEVTFVAGGLGFTSFIMPPIACTIGSFKVAFYSMVFPLDIILAIGTLLAVLLLYGFYKNNKLVGTAEKKLLLVFSYNMILTALAIISFTIIFKNGQAMSDALDEYFFCESNGVDPDRPPCQREFEQYNSPATLTLLLAVVALYPFYSLIFVINIEELKSFFKNVFVHSSMKSSSTVVN